MAKRGKGGQGGRYVDPFAKRRERFEAALSDLGGAEMARMFAAMPRHFLEQVWREKAPDPALVCGEGFPDDPALREEIERAMREAYIDLVPEGDGRVARVTVRDFFGVLVTCGAIVRGTPAEAVAEFPAAVRRFWTEAGPVLRDCLRVGQQAAGNSLWQAVHGVLTAAWRVDARVPTLDMDCVADDRGRVGVRVTVDAVPPEVREVTIGGVARRAYRMSRPINGPEARWMSWTAEELGIEDVEGEIPVYVQSHALHQLADRVNLPAVKPYLQAWMAESLEDPWVVEAQAGGDLLVEFRVYDDRLGYFVATVVNGGEEKSEVRNQKSEGNPKDEIRRAKGGTGGAEGERGQEGQGGRAIVIRTFLFLTMEPTPESRMLKKLLRLSRRERDWLGLTDLAAFTQTDLRDDPVLRPLLAECGCGHLFDLAVSPWLGAPQCKPLAGEMKKFLRMAA